MVELRRVRAKEEENGTFSFLVCMKIIFKPNTQCGGLVTYFRENAGFFIFLIYI